MQIFVAMQWNGSVIFTVADKHKQHALIFCEPQQICIKNSQMLHQAFVKHYIKHRFLSHIYISKPIKNQFIVVIKCSAKCHKIQKQVTNSFLQTIAEFSGIMGNFFFFSLFFKPCPGKQAKCGRLSLACFQQASLSFQFPICYSCPQFLFVLLSGQFFNFTHDFPKLFLSVFHNESLKISHLLS